MGKSDADGAALLARKDDGRPYQRGLGEEPTTAVVRIMGKRMSSAGFGSLPESAQFPRSYKIRPRSARIIGEPKPIRSDNQMISEYRSCHAVNGIEYVSRANPRVAVAPKGHMQFSR
jgi:hypothetical protein